MFWLIDKIIVTPIINVLFLIYHLVGDFGVAIILFTAFIKFITWPIMKKSLAQAKAMRVIQPELTKIKKESKGNRQLETLRMLELYKKYNIKPFRSITNFLIQIPIFIALFAAINVMVSPSLSDNILNRAYQPLQNLSTISDISNKQQEYLKDINNNQYHFYPRFLNSIDLLVKAGFDNINKITIFVFCLIAAFMQFLISKQSLPKSNKSLRDIFKDASNGKEANQSDINSAVSSQMSDLMPIMILSINVNFPGALVFYYMISNIFYYFQQKIIFKENFLTMDNVADKAILKELENKKDLDLNQGIREAKIVSKNKKSKYNITRISANSKKGGKS